MADYRHTILLPTTEYPQRAKLPALERRIRKRWQRMDLYAAIRSARAGQTKWILHDGPPYANGDLHVGTGQNKVLKDIIVRFRTMLGFDAPYVPGWDCHGLPIEHNILRELGERAKTLDAAAIRARCAEYALRFVDRQRRQFEGLGVLGDWGRPYLTLSREYELGIIEMFEQLVDRGYVYRKQKSIKWCITDRTALAEAEVEYRRLRSPAIYIAFHAAGESRDLGEADLLVWTTTPWTIPGNVAVAVNPDIEYVACRRDRVPGAGVPGAGFGVPGAGFGPVKSTSTAVLARRRYEALASRLGLGHVVHSFRGAELEGLRYRHPLWGQPCPVVLADYVTADDGTGLVHTAPGHGEEDFETGQAYGLPTVSPVDEAGIYTDDAREWAGQQVFEANPLIIARLRELGLLLDESEIEHEYPCCWRCKNPLIYRATPQWFISVDAHDGRARALAAVDATRWVPAWGSTRMASMLRDRPDWCISRQRAWGVPIPVFYCTSCQTPDFDFPAAKALIARGGSDAWFTTEAGDILPAGRRCPCGGGEFRKETDIFDVWFESGASQRSVLQQDPTLACPADLYLEGTDQHRGWFQSSLLEGVLGQDQAPFRTVVTHGFLVDARTGDKLSKSTSDFLIPVEEVSAKYGADLFRLWISSVDFTDDIPFSREILDARAPYYVKIRNTFRYLLGSVSDFNPDRDALPYDQLVELDRWALHELATLARGVTGDFESYAFHSAMQRLYTFCVVTMSAVYFDILKDRLYTLSVSSPARRSAQTALHAILRTLVALYAPVLVHTCEEVWEHLRIDGGEPSVHLSRWPALPDGWPDQRLAARYEQLFGVRDAVNRVLERLRQAGSIGRSLDARVEIHAADSALADHLAATDLESLFIVSEVSLSPTPVGEEVTDRPGLWILAERSGNPRCNRCWARRPTVGQDKEYADLCARCVATLRESAG
jgi:isoleucyl-tRNA synthetase